MWQARSRIKTQMGSNGKHVWKKYILECLGRDGKEILKYIFSKNNCEGRGRDGLISLREKGKFFD
jgi:hypothetical protein